MEVAEIWTRFGSQIHQDFLTRYPDLVSGFAFIFDLMSIPEKQQLYDFLLATLNTGPSDEQLAWLLEASGAEIWARGEVRLLFDELLRTLAESLAREGIPPA
jgi:hypothetical protein